MNRDNRLGEKPGLRLMANGRVVADTGRAAIDP